MYCRECGNKLPDGARFCSSCGTPVFADGTHGAFESKEGPAAHSVEPDVSVVVKMALRSRTKSRKLPTNRLLLGMCRGFLPISHLRAV